MDISRDKLKLIRAAMDAAFAAIVKEHGLRSLKAGNCTFTPDGSFTFKVEGVEGGGATKQEQLYDLARSMHPELPERGPAARIQYGGETVELFGANTTLSKVIYRRPDGRAFQTATEAMVAHCKLLARADKKQVRA